MQLLVPLARAALCVVLAAVLHAQVPVRVATWNVQALGAGGSVDWNRAVDTLLRIDADVVLMQGVTDASEVAAFPSFAAAAGYAHSSVSMISGTLSGSLYLGVLSRFPIVSSASHSAASLSGDPGANDITRDIFEVIVQPPGSATVLGLFTVHLKASSGSTNDFRRAIEVHRLSQALANFAASHPSAPWCIGGDFNEDLGDGPFGNTFTNLPSGLPGSFSIGNDIAFPVTYDPFNDLIGLGGLIAGATQEDTTNNFVTRDSSGRRLDYLVYGNGVSLAGDEVYNSVRDNGFDDLPIGNWLMKAGSPLSATTSAQASDHFPVVADLQTPGLPAGVLYPGSGDDFVMSTGVNGAVTTGPGADVKAVSAGDIFFVHYVSPQGTFDFGPPAIVGEAFPFPGIPPFGSLPGMWFDLFGTAFPLYDGLTGGQAFQPAILPVVGNLHAFLVPAGFGGTTFMIQSLVISSFASNGFLAFSDGHRIDVTP